MKKERYAIIVAGGRGIRMNSSIPKQYIELNGLPVLMHTINAFHTTDSNIEIILVIPPDDTALWKDLCKRHLFTVPLTLADGGNSRYESVKNGMTKIKNKNALVAIHDGVRPLISSEIILESYKIAELKGNAVTAVPLKDSIRIVRDGKNMQTERSGYRLVQTPQTFGYQQLKNAYGHHNNPESFTDDASVVEANGESINLIEGSYKNIKITTTEDLKIASCFLQITN